MNTRRLLLFIPFLAAVGLGLFLWKGLSIDPRKLPSALINKPFPEFQQTALMDAQKQLTRADLVGKPTLVNVWGTWCPSCKLEHPELVKVAAEGVRIVGINYKDERPAAKQWLQELGNPYQFNIFDDQGELGLNLGVYGAPETYLIDAKGVVRYRYVGPFDQQIWEQKLKPIFTKISQEP